MMELLSIFHAYGKKETDTLENAMPSPMEKGDRGAVDQGYPGMKEEWRKKKIAFLLVVISRLGFSNVSIDIRAIIHNCSLCCLRNCLKITFDKIKKK